MKFSSIYLASQSPRRRELLQQMSVDFAVIAADVDESVIYGESAQNYVQRIAIDKARAGWENLDVTKPKRPVLAADTAVVLNNQIFGKPVSAEHAKTMLRALSQQPHQVMTAVALKYEDKIESVISVSDVCFASLSEDDIEWYVATGEGDDKAGAYAVQGMAALFIEKIQGSYSGIMGLPIRETGQLLMRMECNGE